MSKYNYNSTDQTQQSKGWIQWGFDALFNPITPFTKRQIQKKAQPKEQSNSLPGPNDDLQRDDDTFYNRKQKLREKNGSKSYSRDDILSDYYKTKELLPDVEDTFSMRRSASYSDRSKSAPNHTSTIPGKFPSPYHSNILTSDLPSSPPPNLLSSTSKNVKLAAKNAEKNKRMLDFNSSPVIIPHGASSLSDYEREQKILKSLDVNIDDLNRLTRDVEKLRVYKDRDYVYDGQRNNKEKVDEYRRELQNELLRSKKLYDSYYEFVKKYKDVKAENQLLNDKLRSIRLKNQKDETTLFNLKSTLQNTTTFEETLKRKIKYLEDKLETFTTVTKEEKFSLNEKIFLLEQKLKDESERHQLEILKREERIEELEGKLKAKRYSLTTQNSFSNTPIRERYSKDDTMDFLNRKFPDRVQSEIHYNDDY